MNHNECCTDSAKESIFKGKETQKKQARIFTFIWPILSGSTATDRGGDGKYPVHVWCSENKSSADREYMHRFSASKQTNKKIKNVQK